MIVHWEQLVRYYGPRVLDHRWGFEEAWESTYALLCCRMAQGDDRFQASRGGIHAEAGLLKDDLWRYDIPRALDAWRAGDTPLVITLAINRSTCRDCAALLSESLGRLLYPYHGRGTGARFVLAMRGQYWGKEERAMTLIPDLKSLANAGWEICVLQEGKQLPERGRELLANIQRVVGRGYVLLDSPLPSRLPLPGAASRR